MSVNVNALTKNRMLLTWINNVLIEFYRDENYTEVHHVFHESKKVLSKCLLTKEILYEISKSDFIKLCIYI